MPSPVKTSPGGTLGDGGAGAGLSAGEGDGTGAGVGDGDGTGDGVGEGDGTGAGVGDGDGTGDGVGDGEGDGFCPPLENCAPSCCPSRLATVLVTVSPPVEVKANVKGPVRSRLDPPCSSAQRPRHRAERDLQRTRCALCIAARQPGPRTLGTHSQKPQVVRVRVWPLMLTTASGFFELANEKACQ